MKNIDDNTILSLTLSATAANDNREPFTPHSIKDLLCDACGRVEAVLYGLCGGCNADASAHYDERRAWQGDDDINGRFED